MDKYIKKVRKWKGQLVLLLVLWILTFTGCGSLENTIDDWAEQQALEAFETIPEPSTEISGNSETGPIAESIAEKDEATTEAEGSSENVLQTEPAQTEPTQSSEVSQKSQNSEPKNSESQNSEPQNSEPQNEGSAESISQASIDENGSYTSKEDVALYLNTYGELPDNFITKSEARALGWEGGSLEPYAPGKCIGGDKFGNYEGLLPAGSYHECDIDTLGKDSRGAKRIVYSADGNIYYTEDHYESFVLLYSGS